MWKGGWGKERVGTQKHIPVKGGISKRIGREKKKTQSTTDVLTKGLEKFWGQKKTFIKAESWAEKKRGGTRKPKKESSN